MTDTAERGDATTSFDAERGVVRAVIEIAAPRDRVFTAFTDPTVTAVQANGGALLNGPMEVPGGDVVAQFTDPQRGYFCVHRTAI